MDVSAGFACELGPYGAHEDPPIDGGVNPIYIIFKTTAAGLARVDMCGGFILLDGSPLNTITGDHLETNCFEEDFANMPDLSLQSFRPFST